MRLSNRHVRLLGKCVTLSEALADEDDILQQLQYPEQRLDLIVSLLENEAEILRIVAQHVSVNQSICKMSDVSEWSHGSFNLCVPIHVNSNAPFRLLFRVPLPYKVGEQLHPGNIDEKLRCEAATYIYVQEFCPEVPIPSLLGFGLTSGASEFTALHNASAPARMWRWVANRLRTLFNYPLPSNFVADDHNFSLRMGYLLLQYVDNGAMLSESFAEHMGDVRRRRNLFGDISRIMISLARIPHHRIGSFTIDDAGFVSLSNRPLTLRLQALENEGIPTTISRSKTYESAESYALDLLAYHDSRLMHQPNSMNDEQDGRRQMSVLGLMRTILPQFVRAETSHGPFMLCLTDLHASNIFVDKDWHMTALIDLEWACTLPCEMLRPPYWLTGQNLDRLSGDHFADFSQAVDHFMTEFSVQEKLMTSANGRTVAMRDNWNTGSFWYFHALESTKGLYNLFKQHIRHRFSSGEELPEISEYWARNVSEVISSKLEERNNYLHRLMLLASSTDCDCEDKSSDFD